MIEKLWASLNITGTSLGILLGIANVEFMTNIYLILGCLSFVLGIVAGILRLVVLIKKALKDGKIDEAEAEDIANQVENIKNDIDEQIKK